MELTKNSPGIGIAVRVKRRAMCHRGLFRRRVFVGAAFNEPVLLPALLHFRVEHLT